jgi:hypothetical protein
VAAVRRSVWFGAGLLAVVVWSGSAHADAHTGSPMPSAGSAARPLTVPPTEPPSETVPGDTTVPPTTPSDLPPAMGPLVVVPSGCAVPPVATAVFRGTITLVDDPDRPTTFRFHVDSVLAGSLDGFAVGELVDVRFGEEAKFLIVDGRFEGRQYILGVAPDAETGLLSSTVREAAPMFGGDAVIGADDSDIDCPRVDDPVRTLRPDGSPVDTGVLTPLKGEGRSLMMAFVTPLAVALAVLVALVLCKHLLFAVGRSLRDIGSDEPLRVERQRRHGGGRRPDGAPRRGWWHRASGVGEQAGA